MILRNKLMWKICLILSLLSLCTLVLFWYHTSDFPSKTTGYDKHKFQEGQDYIDDHGIHVVVGRYVANNDSVWRSRFNAGDLENVNMFNPRPNDGKNGVGIVIPSYMSERASQLFRINRFNLMVSDRIPLDRALPDVRAQQCHSRKYNIPRNITASVVIVFHNEAWSTLLRTVTSVINRSPRNLLKEIILVDDASTRTFLQVPLTKYVATLKVSTYIVRSPIRIGLIQARLLGAKKANGTVLIFLDAHCECTKGWMESLVARVVEDKTRIACPVIDIINDETFAYVRTFDTHLGGFNWDLHFRWFTLQHLANISRSSQSVDTSIPFRTPVMAGGLFAVDKKYFFEMGAYDDQMKIWGGENLELSFRIWQCGGSIEIVPCSHVGHLFRRSSPYDFPGGVSVVLYSNLARVALVWMDEWKNFYFNFHPEAKAVKDKQDIQNRLELRKKLNCQSFKWYLDNIWPEHFMPTNDRFFGKV